MPVASSVSACVASAPAASTVPARTAMLPACAAPPASSPASPAAFTVTTNQSVKIVNCSLETSGSHFKSATLANGRSSRMRSATSAFIAGTSNSSRRLTAFSSSLAAGGLCSTCNLTLSSSYNLALTPGTERRPSTEPYGRRSIIAAASSSPTPPSASSSASLHQLMSSFFG